MIYGDRWSDISFNDTPFLNTMRANLSRRWDMSACWECFPNVKTTRQAVSASDTRHEVVIGQTLECGHESAGNEFEAVLGLWRLFLIIFSW